MNNNKASQYLYSFNFNKNWRKKRVTTELNNLKHDRTFLGAIRLSLESIENQKIDVSLQPIIHWYKPDMTYSTFQINSKKTVFSAQNILLRRSFLILSLLLSVTANYADNVDFNTALRIARTYVNVSKTAAQNVKHVRQQRQHSNLTTSSTMMQAKVL